MLRRTSSRCCTTSKPATSRRAAGRGDQRAQHADRRRLAGAVRAEEAEGLAGRRWSGRCRGPPRSRRSSSPARSPRPPASVRVLVARRHDTSSPCAARVLTLLFATANDLGFSFVNMGLTIALSSTYGGRMTSTPVRLDDLISHVLEQHPAGRRAAATSPTQSARRPPRRGGRPPHRPLRRPGQPVRRVVDRRSASTWASPSRRPRSGFVPKESARPGRRLPARTGIGRLTRRGPSDVLTSARDAAQRRGDQEITAEHLLLDLLDQPKRPGRAGDLRPSGGSASRYAARRSRRSDRPAAAGGRPPFSRGARRRSSSRCARAADGPQLRRHRAHAAGAAPQRHRAGAPHPGRRSASPWTCRALGSRGDQRADGSSTGSTR